MDSWIHQAKLARRLGDTIHEYGPRGECAGYGSVRTGLWEASDRTHRYKCTFVLPPVDDIQQDARQYEPSCKGVPAVWNTAGIKGQDGNAFMRTYKRARGIYDYHEFKETFLFRSISFATAWMRTEYRLLSNLVRPSPMTMVGSVFP